MRIEDINYKGSCIYSISSEENPELFYIGQASNYKIRSKRHSNDLKNSRHGNKRLQRLFNLSRNLVISPIEYCSKEELNDREEFWIKFLDTTNSEKGYNFTTGRNSVPKECMIWSEERKLKWSKRCKEIPIAKGYKKSESWKSKYKQTVNRRREEGFVRGKNLNKKCRVEFKDGKIRDFDSIKEASIKLNIAYTYLTEKIKLKLPVKGLKIFLI